MSDGLSTLYMIVGWAVLVGASGAFFAFGAAAMCRWMQWAPVNFTVHVHMRRDPDDV